MAVVWPAALKEETPQGVAITTEASNKPVQDKGKRKISKSVEAEKIYKFN